MTKIDADARGPAEAGWRDVVWPKEHGSWSLAYEPVAFGLIAAPSVAGAGLAVAVAAAFFARQPLRVAFRSAKTARVATARVALGICGAIAGLAALGTALVTGSLAWLVWLAPVAAGGAIFVGYDLRNAGREALAEVAGAAAFAFVPAVLAVLAGRTPLTALALAVVMIGRAVPTVLGVRAALRSAKGEKADAWSALCAAGLALAAGVALLQAGVAPGGAVIFLAVFVLRTLALLVYPRPRLRARTIGMIEAVLGLGFVVAVGLAWKD